MTKGYTPTEEDIAALQVHAPNDPALPRCMRLTYGSKQYDFVDNIFLDEHGSVAVYRECQRRQWVCARDISGTRYFTLNGSDLRIRNHTGFQPVLPPPMWVFVAVPLPSICSPAWAPTARLRCFFRLGRISPVPCRMWPRVLDEVDAVLFVAPIDASPVGTLPPSARSAPPHDAPHGF